jgi:hypothetical protein
MGALISAKNNRRFMEEKIDLEGRVKRLEEIVEVLIRGRSDLQDRMQADPAEDVQPHAFLDGI